MAARSARAGCAWRASGSRRAGLAPPARPPAARGGGGGAPAPRGGGAHLEGPFLNPEFAGAHPPELLADPADGVPGYYDHPAVRLVTVAPERPGALELIALAAGDRVVLVSDSSTGAGAPPGHYRVGATEFETTADGRALTADGRLAGSTLFLDAAVRRWRDLAGVRLAAALDAAARRPAEVLGLDGELAAGAFADAVLLTDEGAVERVLRRGRWVD